MITLQRSNPTVTQILAAHGCQTTALQDRYDIHTACSSSSFAFPLGLLRLSHIAPNNDNHTDTSLRGVPACVRAPADDAGGRPPLLIIGPLCTSLLTLLPPA